MYYCTIFTCPELYFDNPAVNCLLILGVIVFIGQIIYGLANIKSFFK